MVGRTNERWQRLELEGNAHSAIDGKRVSRAYESVVDARAVGDAIGRHSRGTNARGVAESAEGRIFGVEQVVDVGEHLKPPGGLIRRMQAEYLIARQRCVLIGLIPHVVLVADEAHR